MTPHKSCSICNELITEILNLKDPRCSIYNPRLADTVSKTLASHQRAMHLKHSLPWQNDEKFADVEVEPCDLLAN
jgi:hypothetical protein